MASARTKLHKAVFEALSTRVAPTFLQHGFVKHPAYEDGWEPYNQEYTVDLVKNEFHRYVFQLKITYWPQYSSVRVEIIRSENSFAIGSLEDFPTSAGDWSDLWMYQPYTTLRLCSGHSWNPFSNLSDFKIKLREHRNPSAELDRLVLAVNKRVPYLLDAMTGSDRRTYIDVEHQHIDRPSG